jgi:hypothetical protein
MNGQGLDGWADGWAKVSQKGLHDRSARPVLDQRTPVRRKMFQTQPSNLAGVVQR